LEGEILAKVTPRSFRDQTSVLVRGQSYTLRRVYAGLGDTRRARRRDHIPDPDVLAAARLSRRIAESDFAPSEREDQEGDIQEDDSLGAYLVEMRQLVNDFSGLPVLWTSGDNYNWRATRFIACPDRRWIRFPVYGSEEQTAVMAAVDQSGGRHVLYKTAKPHRSEVKVIVNPADELSDELLLVVALSADLLHRYFQLPRSGGLPAY
jgi:hypothetical protein